MTGGSGSRAGVAVRLLPMGEEALLVEVGAGDPGGGADDDGAAVVDGVLALRAACEEAVAAGEGVWADVAEVVPAARTVLLVTGPGADLGALGARVRDLAGRTRPDPAAVADAEEVEVEVVYDGPDLEEVASITGLSREEVVAAHTGTPWRVGFGGFAPGFAYLVGGDPRLEVPRRSDPRTRVPAGSVGLAGTLSGIYPRPSPGGWQLIGTTEAVLWDVDRDPPALLTPGLVVRFVEAGS